MRTMEKLNVTVVDLLSVGYILEQLAARAPFETWEPEENSYACDMVPVMLEARLVQPAPNDEGWVSTDRGYDAGRDLSLIARKAGTAKYVKDLLEDDDFDPIGD